MASRERGRVVATDASRDFRWWRRGRGVAGRVVAAMDAGGGGGRRRSPHFAADIGARGRQAAQPDRFADDAEDCESAPPVSRCCRDGAVPRRRRRRRSSAGRGKVAAARPQPVQRLQERPTVGEEAVNDNHSQPPGTASLFLIPWLRPA